MSYDAVVIGAGPAGSTAALLLARAGWSVALVEKSAFPRRKVCGEFISAPALTLLARLGVAADILAQAGPEVREVAVYAGERVIAGSMPRAEGPLPYGRALGREHLDTLLLESARAAGATLWQPWRVTGLERIDRGYVCTLGQQSRDEDRKLSAPVVIAAHGSWDTARFGFTGAAPRARASDLLAFKAHFAGATLETGRMPLVAFRGGYGGLVMSDSGRVSFSCCIRRDVLAECRAEMPGVAAGAAVLAHVFGSCRGMRGAVGDATREHAWLAAGPLRPGMRSAGADGYFVVGNAIGEAHPIVAEGISMAIQSAWLLCERLVAAAPVTRAAQWSEVARDYEAVYRDNFGQRIRASSAFSMLAMRPAAAGVVAGLLEHVPGLLSAGARWAGKASPLHSSA